MSTRVGDSLGTAAQLAISVYTSLNPGVGNSSALRDRAFGFPRHSGATKNSATDPPASVRAAELTVTDIIDGFVVLAMFIVPPFAGIASLRVARSKTVLEGTGSVATGRLSFGIAAGVSVWALVAAYIGTAINCGANWIVR